MLIIKLVILFTGLTVAASRRHVDFYRKDYTFFEEFDAFYKIHWDLNGIAWNEAFMACYYEGAELFYPIDKEEWRVVKNLTAALPNQPNVTDIFTGIPNVFSMRQFITVDGETKTIPLKEDQVAANGSLCMLMNIETGSYKVDSCGPDTETIRPYVCKKVDDKITCPTIDRGYIYENKVNKCYKVNNRSKTWSEAMDTCHIEGGRLAMFMGDTENEIRDKIISKNMKYFVGAGEIYPHGGFFTLRGQFMFERNILMDNKECMCLVYSSSDLGFGDYLGIHCQMRLPFICEMDVKLSN